MKNTFPRNARDHVLSFVGLQRRRSTAAMVWTALGIFGGALMLGAGLGMLFAPRSGAEIRRGIAGRFRRIGLASRRRRAYDELDVALSSMSTDYDAPPVRTPTAAGGRVRDGVPESAF